MPPEITTSITSLRWTSDKIDTEIAFLRTYSSGFKKVLEDMSPTVGGVALTKVVVTDNVTLVSNTGTWLSSEQVKFDPTTGTLFLGINPNETTVSQLDGRRLSIGETIAHGLGHYTADGLAAGGWGPGEAVAVSYANLVASNFGLSATLPLRVSSSPYHVLHFCRPVRPGSPSRILI